MGCHGGGWVGGEVGGRRWGGRRVEGGTGGRGTRAAATTLFRWCPPEPVFPAARCGSSSPRWRRSWACSCSASGPVRAQAANLVASRPGRRRRRCRQPPTEIVLTFDAPDRRLQPDGHVACNGDPFTEPNIGRPEVGRRRADAAPSQILRPMPVGHVQRGVDASTSPTARTAPNGRFSFTVLNSPTPTPGATTPGDGPTATGTTPPSTTAAGGSDVGRRARPACSTRRTSPTVRPGSAACCRRSASPSCSARSCSSSSPGRRDPSTSSPSASCARCGSSRSSARCCTSSRSARPSTRSRSARGLNPATWLDLLDAGWPGRAADRPPRARHRLRLGRAAPRAGHRPDDAAAGDRHPDARRDDDRADPDRRRPRRHRRPVRHRPRPRDGDLGRRRRAAGPRRAGRSGRGGPRARRARVRPDLRAGDRRHRRQRPRPAVPPRRRLAVQHARTGGCSC